LVDLAGEALGHFGFAGTTRLDVFAGWTFVME